MCCVQLYLVCRRLQDLKRDLTWVILWYICSHPFLPVHYNWRRDWDIEQMMATIEKIDEFCLENEGLLAYLERVELYFAANDIP